MTSKHALTWANIADKSGKRIQHRTGTWDELITQLSATKTYGSKAECPWLKLAVFGEHRGPGGSLRNNANVLAVTGIEADYDGEQLSIPAAVELLTAAGIKAAIYPSASNTPDKPRWRVLCPLSEPQAPEDRQLFVARLNGVLGGVIADESFTLSQSYYYGNVGTNDYQLHATDGTCLDQLPGLDSRALYKAKSRLPPRPATQYEATESASAATLEDLRSALTAVSATDRTEWIAMGMRLKTLGDVGFELWDTWSQTATEVYDPDDAEYRWDSFEPNSTGYKAVFTAATAAGWANPGPAPASADDFDVVPEDEPPAEDAKHSAWSLPAAIGADEWGAARSTPTCVVDKMLFADVATLVAPGGMGKTTLILFKAVHIALGRPLFGLEIHTPGPVLILTSEDSRELLVARLRHICQEMFLTDDELATVRERVRISDLSGGSFKLTEVVRDVVRTTKAVKAIADAARALGPVWLVIDPAVSFGVGESRVNDAEQGLIEAARYLRNHLPGCCVEYVHHTGKTNGRDKTIDQYSGRGGSAFADGSRMVMVLQSLDAKEWLKQVGEILEPGCSGLVLARAKLSYCPPQAPIYLRRRGYTFEVVAANSGPVADERQEQADKVWRFLADELACGRRYSKSSAEIVYKDISQKALRSALAFLEADGRLEERERPKDDRPGNVKTYVHPVEGSLAVENSALDVDQILTNANGPDLD
jgi:RecA-family ATPase